MQWYEEVLDRIDDKKIYCHKELIDELRMLKTDLSESTYHWAISGLVRDGALTRLGYGRLLQNQGCPEKAGHEITIIISYGTNSKSY